MTQIDIDIFRNILQGQLQYLTPKAREDSAIRTVEKLNYVLEKTGVPPLPELADKENTKLNKHLEELRNDGITLLGPVFSQKQVADIQDDLNKKRLYNGHVWAFSNNKRYKRESLIKKRKNQASYILKDTLSTPHIVEAISDPFILKLVEKYLGATPTVFQSNIMWTLGTDKSPAVAQHFHRDWDNFKFCVLFIYLTDVTEKNGPHQYIKKTHLVKGVEEAIEKYKASTGDTELDTDVFYNDPRSLGLKYYDKVFTDQTINIQEPAGFAFITDAFGLHKGVPPIEGERLLLWSRYGLYDNGYSVDVTPAPLPYKDFSSRLPVDDKTHRFIFRSLFKTEYTCASNISLHNSSVFFENENKKASFKHKLKVLFTK